MPNRSNSHLSSFYVAAPADPLDNRELQPAPLNVFEITYLHFHSVLELGVCISGRGCCVVDDREYPFSAGDVQIIFPFQNHLSRNEGDEMSRWIWTNFDPLHQLSAWGAPELSRLERLLYDGMGLCGIIDRKRYPLPAELIARAALPGHPSLRLACLHALIEELARESEPMPRLKLRPERAFRRFEPAVALAEDQLNQGRIPTVAAMADACALSVSAFRRGFRQAMGRSPQQYIQACQMRRAQNMLLFTGASVTEVAFSAGYQDVSGFNRLFLNTFGMSPREYRRVNRPG